MKKLFTLFLFPYFLSAQTDLPATRVRTDSLKALKTTYGQNDSIHVKSRMRHYRTEQFDSMIVLFTPLDTAYSKSVATITGGYGITATRYNTKDFQIKVDTTRGVGLATDYKRIQDSLTFISHLEDTTLLSPYIAYKNQPNVFTKKNTFTTVSLDTMLYINSLKNSILFVNANQTVTSGTATSFRFGVLNNSSGNFNEGMVGKIVYRVTSANNTDDAANTTRAPETWTKITKFVNDTSIELAYNIFDATSSPYYVIDNHSGVASLMTGINTLVATNMLIDTNASFTAGLVGKIVVVATTSPRRATIQSVVSSTRLTLSYDIFTDTSFTYAIKLDTINDFRYIQSAVNGVYSKNGSHFVFVGDGKYRENVLVSEGMVGTGDSKAISQFWLPRIFIVGNFYDYTTVKIIGVSPANDSSFSNESDMREIFEVSGSIGCVIRGFYGLQGSTFIRGGIHSDILIVRCGLRNIKQGQGTGITAEAGSFVGEFDCFWTNLFQVAYVGRANAMLQIDGTLNTADSCSYLFSGGKSVVQIFPTAVLTVSGNPTLQYTPSGFNSLSIITNSTITGGFTMNPVFHTGTAIDDTLFAKYETISNRLSLNSLADATFPLHENDALGLVNSRLSQLSGVINITGTQQDAAQTLFRISANNSSAQQKAFDVILTAGTPNVLMTTAAAGADPTLSLGTAGGTSVTFSTSNNTAITGTVTLAHKLSSGVTIEQGKYFYDSVQHVFYGDQKVVRRTFDMSHNALVDTQYVSGTTSETNLDTIIMGANYPAIGKYVKTEWGGHYNATGGGAKTFIFRVKKGTTLIDSVTVTTPAGGSSSEEVEVTNTISFRTIGVSAGVHSRTKVISENGAKLSSHNSTFDTTTENLIIFSVQISHATAGNNFTLDQGITTTKN